MRLFLCQLTPHPNAVEGVDYSPVYLERFFRNLLLGDQWDLRNRYLHIQPSKEWRIQPNLANPSSTHQVAIKHPSSAWQVPDKLHTDDPNIARLVEAVGEQTLSVKEMMAALELKDRVNFQNLYLSPAIKDGFVRMLYPNSPKHPRQKYLLTAKGIAVYQELTKR
jgi:hypothetical protein